MLWMYAVCALSIFVCLPFFLYYKKALHMKLAAAFKSLGTICISARVSSLPGISAISVSLPDSARLQAST